MVSMRGRIQGTKAGTLGLIGAIGLLVSSQATADWDVYVSGGLGISGNLLETQGLQSGQVLGGEDSDTSTLIDGAVGLEIPMDELVPREWLTDIRLPAWPVRFEIEAAGLREYELRTFAAADVFFTELEATTLFFNTWVDFPLVEVARPFQYLFGLGRQPRVRQWLEPGRLFAGVGVGMSALDVRGTSNAIRASDDFIEFAWNAGAGVDYALTDAVDLSVGYRFLCLSGDCMAHSDGLDLTPTGGAPLATDFLSYDIQSHELRVQIRVEVFDFRNPWR